jgi:hypothetical protein
MGSEDFLTYVCNGDVAEMAAVKQFCESNNAVRSDIFEERIDKANELINTGNDVFKAGDSLGAKQWYLAAAHHADFDLAQQHDLQVTHKMQIRGILIRVLLNFSNNALKLQDFISARNACSLGLQLATTGPEVPPDIIAKFLYRRANALFGLNMFKEAADDSKKALDLIPTDGAIKALFTRAMAEVIKSLPPDERPVIASAEQPGKARSVTPDMGYVENLPNVDLVLIDDNGDRVGDVDMPQSGPSYHPDGEKSGIESFMELICCKRKPKQH